VIRVLVSLALLTSACASHPVNPVEEAPAPAKVRFFETVLRDQDKLRKLICKSGICRYMEIEAKGSSLSLRSCSIKEDQLFWSKVPNEAVVSDEINAKCEDRVLDSGVTAFYVESQEE